VIIDEVDVGEEQLQPFTACYTGSAWVLYEIKSKSNRVSSKLHQNPAYTPKIFEPHGNTPGEGRRRSVWSIVWNMKYYGQSRWKETFCIQ